MTSCDFGMFARPISNCTSWTLCICRAARRHPVQSWRLPLRHKAKDDAVSSFPRRWPLYPSKSVPCRVSESAVGSFPGITALQQQRPVHLNQQTLRTRQIIGPCVWGVSHSTGMRSSTQRGPAHSSLWLAD
jgi:hypothetical protein